MRMPSACPQTLCTTRYSQTQSLSRRTGISKADKPAHGRQLVTFLKISSRGMAPTRSKCPGRSRCAWIIMCSPKGQPDTLAFSMPSTTSRFLRLQRLLEKQTMVARYIVLFSRVKTSKAHSSHSMLNALRTIRMCGTPI